MRDRNNNNARAEHLNEIIQTRVEFFDRQSEIQEKYAKYKDIERIKQQIVNETVEKEDD